jgi:hypothetical protein
MKTGFNVQRETALPKALNFIIQDLEDGHVFSDEVVREESAERGIPCNLLVLFEDAQ